MSAIKAFAKQCGYTHAEPSTSGMFTFYAVEKCEVCKGEIQAPNAIGVKATLTQVKAAGLVVAPSPDEGGYCDELNVVTCPSCYV